MWPSFGMRGQLVTVVFNRAGVQISSGPGYEPTPVESPTPLPTPERRTDTPERETDKETTS